MYWKTGVGAMAFSAIRRMQKAFVPKRQRYTLSGMESSEATAGSAPLVSVLVCAFNAERFLGLTLQTICAQTWPNLEILVLDNGSRDRTAEVLREWAGRDCRVQPHFSPENLGPYGGLNYLLERVRGDYVAIQDHDDLWHADKIRRQVDYLERHPDCAGCGTAILNHYEKPDRFLLRRQAPESTLAWHTTLVFRRGSARYDLSVPVGTDFHFMRVHLCRGRKCIHNLPAPFVLRRLRADGGNLSSRWIRGHGREILRANIGGFDKLCLLNRLWLPSGVMDWLVLHVFLRGQAWTREQALAAPDLRELLVLAAGPAPAGGAHA